MSKRKNETGLDFGAASVARFDGDTVTDLKELISKLVESKDVVQALEQNDLAGMVTFLESFESAAVESKFILHHVTQAVVEKRPERLLRWALVYMLRNSNVPPDRLQHEVLRALTTKPH